MGEQRLVLVLQQTSRPSEEYARRIAQAWIREQLSDVTDLRVRGGPIGAPDVRLEVQKETLADAIDYGSTLVFRLIEKARLPSPRSVLLVASTSDSRRQQ